MVVADLESCNCSRMGSTMTELDKMARELLADKIFQRDSGCFALPHIIRRGE